MQFVQESDYLLLIKSDKLDTVIGNDCNVLRAAESAAQAEVISYLSNRFDTDKIFSPVLDYNVATAFTFFSRIFLDSSPYNITVTYVTGNVVKYQNKVYKSISGNAPGAFNPLQWDLLGDVGFYSLDAPVWNVSTAYLINDIVKIDYTFYRALSNNTAISPEKDISVWLPITTLTGEIPATSQYWINGDTRSQHILMRVIDLILYHLHSRINPRNIPEFRIARRDEAIQWFRDITKGLVTPNLPLILPEQGNNIAYGSLTLRKNQSY